MACADGKLQKFCALCRSDVARCATLFATLTHLAWSLDIHRGMFRQPVGMLPTPLLVEKGRVLLRPSLRRHLNLRRSMLNAIMIAISCVGALGAQVPDQQGHVGYCAATTSSERGCHPGSGKGYWVLNAREAASWPHARAACAAKCAQCSQCAFVSISLLNHDCSWFSQDQCNLDRLETEIHGFQTYEASSPLLLAAAAAVAQTDSSARESKRRMPWEAQRLPGERRSNCATPCVPSAACAAEVRAWAFDKQTDNGVYFWVLTLPLPLPLPIN